MDWKRLVESIFVVFLSCIGAGLLWLIAYAFIRLLFYNALYGVIVFVGVVLSVFMYAVYRMLED